MAVKKAKKQKEIIEEGIKAGWTLARIMKAVLRQIRISPKKANRFIGLPALSYLSFAFIYPSINMPSNFVYFTLIKVMRHLADVVENPLGRNRDPLLSPNLSQHGWRHAE